MGETRAFLQIVDRDPCQLLLRNNHHLMYIYIYIYIKHASGHEKTGMNDDKCYRASLLCQ